MTRGPRAAAVTQAMSKSATLSASVLNSLKGLACHPIVFARSPAHLAVYGVYAATYLAGNTAVTLCERGGLGVGATNLWKLWLAFGVNTSTSILKDRAFARCARFFCSYFVCCRRAQLARRGQCRRYCVSARLTY